MTWLLAVLLAGGIEQFDYCLNEQLAVQVAKTYAERGERAAFDNVTDGGSLVGCFRDGMEGSKVRLVGKKRIVTFEAANGLVHVEQVIVTDPWFSPHHAVYRIVFEPAAST